jgi:hypothetical protein
MLNSTVLMVAMGMTYLLVDPVCKAFYVLRRFYGRSLYSGNDLRVRMRKLATASLAAVLVIFSTCVVVPRAEAVQAAQVDQSVENVLNRPEYAWRSPRLPEQEKQNGTEETASAFEKTLNKLFGYIKKPFKWLLNKLEEWAKQRNERDYPDSHAASLQGLSETVKILAILLIGVVAVVVLYLLWVGWRRRSNDIVISAQPIAAVPDIRSEDVTADQLPEDSWLAMAEDLLAKGDHRLSIRAMYLAGLAHLGKRELVTITRAKSNKQFRDELARRARSQQELQHSFSESVSAFERAWYGLHTVDADAVLSYRENVKRIFAC